MTLDDFRVQMNRLRKHFGESNYSDELLMILWDEFQDMRSEQMLSIVTECIATRPKSKPPLRNEIKQIAIDLGVQHGVRSSWTYFEVEDCMVCGGPGWYWIARDYQKATRVCNDCDAGRNLQKAPRPIMRETKVPQDWAWAAPGREKRSKSLHPVIQKKYRNWDGLERAIRENYSEVFDLLKRYSKYVAVPNGVKQHGQRR